ncbi:MAG: hypothetical protein RSC89_01930, partial [Oscillospiraceae bacterium]
KETITGQEMMKILEGKDPATAENFGAIEDDQRPVVPPVAEMPIAQVGDPHGPTEEPPVAAEPPADLPKIPPKNNAKRHAVRRGVFDAIIVTGPDRHLPA